MESLSIFFPNLENWRNFFYVLFTWNSISDPTNNRNSPPIPNNSRPIEIVIEKHEEKKPNVRLFSLFGNENTIIRKKMDTILQEEKKWNAISKDGIQLRDEINADFNLVFVDGDSFNLVLLKKFHILNNLLSKSNLNTPTYYCWFFSNLNHFQTCMNTMKGIDKEFHFPFIKDARSSIVFSTIQAKRNQIGLSRPVIPKRISPLAIQEKENIPIFRWVLTWETAILLIDIISKEKYIEVIATSPGQDSSYEFSLRKHQQPNSPQQRPNRSNSKTNQMETISENKILDIFRIPNHPHQKKTLATSLVFPQEIDCVSDSQTKVNQQPGCYSISLISN